MKIAFVYPATEFDHAFHKYALPSGLLSLAAVIETTGLGTVDIFDSRHMSGIPDKEELKKLPRIGDVKAQSIIDYRQKIGLFKDIKNITDVSGIGPKLFDNIKDKITVR